MMYMRIKYMGSRFYHISNMAAMVAILFLDNRLL